MAMAAADLHFSEGDMSIDGAVGYPTAYAKICRDLGFGPYSHGPPFTFTPYPLQPQEAMRAEELDEMFPVMDPKAKHTAKAKIFTSLLWKQLDHLGNAGFDPEKFRVDPYGNVLYFHADAASPLAWDIDHWFPCSRGGLTVPSNLKILQWQVCKKKHNKLEFLIPWWDLQVGISVNQFLSIFASSNSDFRHRAFSLLFANGKNEEPKHSQTVDSHSFPQHFVESKEKLGLAPAAVVVPRREAFDDSSTLKSLDINRRLRSNSPVTAARKLKTSGLSKENENPDIVVNNPYQAIVLARDSLRQREETTKIQTEIQRLDDEVNELKQKNDEERVNIQDLELVLISRRRRAEKCRRLAEAQSSYKAMLEKMIRDAMHQSVIYKEQLRLNQAASNALMARLEAQKAICDSSERELHKKFKHRDELEKQIRPEWEKGRRKRSRMEETFNGERDEKTVFYLPGSEPIAHLGKEKEGVLREDEDEDSESKLPGIDTRTVLHKELRVFLEEEHKASEAGLSLNGEESEQRFEKGRQTDVDEHEESDNNPIEVMAENEKTVIKDRLQKLRIREGMSFNNQFADHEPEGDEDDECRKQRGKGNVEKWLQMLLEGTDEDAQIAERNTSKTDVIIKNLSLKYPQNEIKILKFRESADAQGIEHASEDNVQYSIQKKVAANEEDEIVEVEAFEKYDGEKNKEASEIEARKIHLNDPPYILSEKSNANEIDCVDKAVGSSRSEKSGKVVVLKRSKSARPYRRIPSSPPIILGMRKGGDSMGKKPVIGDDEGDQNEAISNFFKSSIKLIKNVVKI